MNKKLVNWELITKYFKNIYLFNNIKYINKNRIIQVLPTLPFPPPAPLPSPGPPPTLHSHTYPRPPLPSLPLPTLLLLALPSP